MILSKILEEQGKPAEALDALKRSVELYRDPGLAPTSLAIALVNLAQFHVRQGKYTEALACYEESQKIRTRLLGPEHPNTLVTEQEIAWILWKAGQPEEALQRSRPAVESIGNRLGWLDQAPTTNSAPEASGLRHVFERHMALLGDGTEGKSGHVDESIITIQRARSTSASRSLQIASVRLGLQDSIVAHRMQDYRRLTSRLASVRAALLKEYVNRAEAKSLRLRLENERDALLEELKTADAALHEEAPELMQQLNREPLGVKDIRRLLTCFGIVDTPRSSYLVE